MKGEIKITGRKNAALPLLAASLLTDDECEFSNAPQIGDVKIMLEILEKIGAKIRQDKDRLTIKTSSIRNTKLPLDLTRKLRASILFLGPMLARTGEIQMAHPGGCIIGKRPVGVHLDALRSLGTVITQDQDYYYARIGRSGLKGKTIYLKEASVTATETLMMAAVLVRGKTVINNAAGEPHIIQLADFLNSLDYSVAGAGSHQITIYGRSGLSHHSAQIKIIPDDLEVGTWAVLGALSNGKLILRDCGPTDYLLPILQKLNDFNVSYRLLNNKDGCDLEILHSPDLCAANIQTGVWPGFPTDLQPPFTVLATQAIGASLVHDWMYEGRLYYVDSLQKMGANITICDPHRALINGPTKFYGGAIVSPDIRAGMALLIAALIAEGKSKIDHIELIDRGYENIDFRLRALGAEIKRVA